MNYVMCISLVLAACSIAAAQEDGATGPAEPVLICHDDDRDGQGHGAADRW